MRETMRLNSGLWTVDSGLWERGLGSDKGRTKESELCRARAGSACVQLYDREYSCTAPEYSTFNLACIPHTVPILHNLLPRSVYTVVRYSNSTR